MANYYETDSTHSQCRRSESDVWSQVHRWEQRAKKAEASLYRVEGVCAKGKLMTPKDIRDAVADRPEGAKL